MRAPAIDAQTLPQSTLDRQQIMELQNELSGNPSITPEARREIEMQITTLQYHINTRPLIAPPPNLAPKAAASPIPSAAFLNATYRALTGEPQRPLDGSPVAAQTPCQQQAAIQAHLRVVLDAPLAAERGYAREALRRLRAVPC